jgi:hypothetical protein
MENQKKFFFNKEENVASLLGKLGRQHMNSIVGGDYKRKIYSESTHVPKPPIIPIR